MSEKTTPSSHPSVPTPEPTPYPEIAEQAQRLADEGEDVPSLPEVPPLPVTAAAPPSVPPAPPAKDRERVLVRICIALTCLFFVALFVLAFTCQCTIADPAALREAILGALADGPAMWIQIQARAVGNLDVVAAGLVLTELEAEGLVLHSREPGAAQSVYRLAP